MEIVMKRDFTNEQIAGLLCSALEGGSNYWYFHSDTKDPFKDDSGLDDWGSIYRAPLSTDGWIKIQDMEDGGTEYLLNRTIIKEGLELMATKYPEHFGDFVTENYDAITGDVFLQCCLFRDLVYG